MEISVTHLSSGYFHVRGSGPCNWAQPRLWPCDEVEIRRTAFPEASEEFIRAAVRQSVDAVDPHAADTGKRATRV